MGNRMRFNAREKALLAQLARGGTPYCEVSYGSGQWIFFRLDTTMISRDDLGHQRIEGTVESDTNTKGQKSKVISRGWRMGATPGHVRPVGSDWKVT